MTYYPTCTVCSPNVCTCGSVAQPGWCQPITYQWVSTTPESRLSDEDIERIAKKLAELLKPKP